MDDQMPFKLGVFDGANWYGHRHADVYLRIEGASAPAHLVCAPSMGHVELIIGLAGALSGPFGLLYILESAEGEYAAGKYKVSENWDHGRLAQFLRRYRAFLEGDGRHQLWISSPDEEAVIIYDLHDLIYAYGPADAFETVALTAGLQVGAVEVPTPHMHRYHEGNSEVLASLMAETEWVWTGEPDDA